MRVKIIDENSEYERFFQFFNTIKYSDRPYFTMSISLNREIYNDDISIYFFLKDYLHGWLKENDIKDYTFEVDYLNEDKNNTVLYIVIPDDVIALMFKLIWF